MRFTKEVVEQEPAASKTGRGRRGRTPTKKAAIHTEVVVEQEPAASPKKRGRQGRTPTKQVVEEIPIVGAEPEPEPVTETRRGRQSRAPKRYVQSPPTPKLKSKKEVPAAQPQPKRAKSLPPTTSKSRTRHQVETPQKVAETPTATRSSRRRRG